MMKRILTVFLVALTLAACKNNKENGPEKSEEKTTTTGTSTSTGENATEETAQAVDAVTEDADGIYKLKYHLEEGQSYPLVIVQKDVSNVTMGKENHSETNTTTDDISFKVTKFHEDTGIYDIDLIFNSKKQVGTTMGKTLTYDTSKPEPTDPDLKTLWKINKAMMGQVLKMQMSQEGKILKIEGFGPVHQKVSAAITPLIQDKDQRTAMIEGFKHGFNEEVLKEQFASNFQIFPEKGLKIGESFSQVVPMTEDGSLKNTTTYTLKSVENGIAELSVKGGFPKKTEKQSQEGITATMSVQGNQTGSVKLSSKTGWIENSTMQMVSTQTTSYTDGKQTETATQKTTSTTTFNP